MSPLTTAAMDAVGADEPGTDWRLAPGDHAARLPAEAGALRRVLERAELAATIGDFTHADRRAVAAQRRYKRVGRIGLYAAVGATLVGAIFILFPRNLWPEQLRGLAVAFLCLQYSCLAASFLASVYLTRFKVFDRWMKARADAELLRLSLFSTVAEAEEPSRPGELPLLPLKLEYFRRYQLDVQQRYYAGRGREHARSAGQSRRWVWTSYVLTGVAGLVAAVALIGVLKSFGIPLPPWLTLEAEQFAPTPDTTNRISIAAGVAASALFGAGITRSLMDLDERNASRYLTNADNLRFLAEQGLAAARDAAAGGDGASVASFVARIQDLVSSEHREWALLRDIMPKADPKRVHIP